MNKWMNSWIIDWMNDSMNNWMNNWMKDSNYLVSKPFPLGIFWPRHLTHQINWHSGREHDLYTYTFRVDMRDWFVHLHCESYLFMGWYQGPVDASGCQMEENWITIDIFDLLEKMSSKSKIKISKFLIKSWRRDGGGITNMSLK